MRLPPAAALHPSHITMPIVRCLSGSWIGVVQTAQPILVVLALCLVHILQRQGVAAGSCRRRIHTVVVNPVQAVPLDREYRAALSELPTPGSARTRPCGVTMSTVACRGLVSSAVVHLTAATIWHFLLAL